MITSVLVANRGEIARRVFRTCRDRGLATVAVFSDADADAPYVREADAAVRLPGNAPADTYLRADRLIDAARRAGADAVHPGYGFLSENAEFAQAVLDAGLTWLGPRPEAIAAMGDKITAKRLMAEAGVPVLTDLDPAGITSADLPVLVKASAGGGGRGMRVVRTIAELPGEVEAARAEAASAFGDPTVFVEPYLARGHHLEVQVLADVHGTVWAVGERECSVQRRHQKVIEEAPAPLVERIGPELRERLFAAARSAAAAVHYTGVGTVEFIADDDGRFFFLEMNTRLQVEHPVTEATTGLDLVARQLDVAVGARLAAQPPPTAGHAIEARLYAEDPAADWAPQSGQLYRFAVPGVDVEFSTGATAAGLRLDAGVEDTTAVGVHYDPMLAKVIAWAPTRAAAIDRLARALAHARIHGVVTNRDLLVRVLRHPAFRAGDTDTAFFDRHGLPALAAPLADHDAVESSALAAALAIDADERAAAAVLGRMPSGWRNVVSAPRTVSFAGRDVVYRLTRDGLDTAGDVALVSAAPDQVVLDVAGVRRTFAVAVRAEAVDVDSALGPVSLRRVPRFVDPAATAPAGSLVAPMPGTVARVAVAVGDTVAAGDPVLWLEAMKMQHRVDAPVDGVVSAVAAEPGRTVEVGTVLAVVEPVDPPPAEE